MTEIPRDERTEQIERERTAQLRDICFQQATLAHNRSIALAGFVPVALREAEIVRTFVELWQELGCWE